MEKKDLDIWIRNLSNEEKKIPLKSETKTEKPTTEKK